MHVFSVRQLIDIINEKMDSYKTNKENIKTVVRSIGERGDYDID